MGVSLLLGAPIAVAVAPATAAQEAATEPRERAQEGNLPRDLTELSLEQLMAIRVDTVYGASKRVQATTQAPSSVTIVTAREIEAQGWRTLADLLRSVRSFQVTDDRNYEHLGVRGFNPIGDFNGRVLLLVDGHRINNNIYDSAPIGLEFPLDVDLIERVEIIRGPGSSLYGSNAVFGVIDVVTRKGASFGGIEASGEAGSFRSWRGRVTWGKELDGGVDVLLSGTLQDSEGDDLFYPEYVTAPSGGRTSGTDYESAYSLFSRVTCDAWRLEGAWGSRKKGIPTGSYGTVFDDPDNRTVDAQGYLDLSYDRRLSETWTFAGRVHYDHYYYRGTYIYDDTANGGPPDLENDDRAVGSWWGTSLSLSTTCIEDHRVTVGAELRHDVRRDQSNRDVNAVYLDDDREGLNWGAFAQDEVRLAERWSLNAGVRYDRYDSFGGTLNPRVGLIWNPDQTSAWKLLYGQAFRAPNAYELYYQDGGNTQKASPDLDPETIRSWEFVHERHFGESWRASASAFHNEMDHLVVLMVDPLDGLLVFRNAADAVANGLELEVERVFLDGVRLLGSVTLQRVEDESTGDLLPNSPRQMVRLAAESPVGTDWVLAGAELQWIGARDTLAGAEADGFTVVNLTLRTKELENGLRASVTLRNLFDADYSDPGGTEHVQDLIPQDGRTLLARLSWRL